MMTSQDPTESPQLKAPQSVRCEVCQAEIPADEALSREAEDYVLWFCGQGCYTQWLHEHEDK